MFVFNRAKFTQSAVTYREDFIAAFKKKAQRNSAKSKVK